MDEHEAQLRNFIFERLLNQDTLRKSICLLGTIQNQQAIITAEKVAFSAAQDALSKLTSPQYMVTGGVTVLERNDIYHWFLSQLSGRASEAKLTLIYPATETHIRKYSAQKMHMVTETPEMYEKLVKPYVDEKRGNGRLNWVYNILEHRAETERILFEDPDKEAGFILLPDLKWDRKTLEAMYLMVAVHRRDVTSLRDLNKSHVPWLRDMRQKVLDAVEKNFPPMRGDELKIYLHYQPSYYHFHLHVVSLGHDAGTGQAAGKALLLENVIYQLENMSGGDKAGFADIPITYVVGEESELWAKVFRVMH